MIDLINHPPHYKANGIESIDVIEAFGLGFRLGNAVKYILRHNRKGAPIADLEKARWYLTREIAKLREGRKSKKCLVETCERVARVRGLCDGHRKRAERSRPIEMPLRGPHGKIR